jgi:hypothetical protein
MRVLVVMVMVLLCGCASDRLALAPPQGVDFSGHWRLDVEESDDPLHLIQSQNVDPSKATAGSQGQGGPGGQGGRGGRGSRGGGAFPGGTNFSGPATPTIAALSEAFRWPGKEIDIKQVAGVVAVTSAGVNEVYQPTTGAGKSHPHRKPSDDDDAGGRDRDMPARDRGRPPICGWDDKTLVVQSIDTDEDHPPFEKRYSVSEDGRQLIEVVGFKGGRSGGFTMSRTWDRVDANAPPPPAPHPAAPEGIRPSPE